MHYYTLDKSTVPCLDFW